MDSPEAIWVNSNPGGYLKEPWVAAISLNSLLKGSRSSPQPPRISMRKTHHQAGQYSQLAEFSVAKCKKYEIKEQIYVIVTF
jgi:hypothetical protein